MTAQPQTYRQQMHLKAKLSDKARIVFEWLILNGPDTRKQIAACTGLSLSCVCGRVGDMQALGMVFTADANGGQIVTADPDPEGWKARADQYTLNKQLDRIQKFVADYGPRLDETTLQGLRRLYSAVRVSPL